MGKSKSYQPRLYRETMGNKRWRSFRSAFRETDLWVAVDSASYTGDTESYVMSRILYYRDILEKHIASHPEFMASLVPVMAPAGVHPLITSMSEAAQAAGTGPMSAVAGAMAEYICNDISETLRPKEIIIENGGDLFMILNSPATIAVYAGSSPLSGKIGLKVKPEDTPLSICCSSGTVGHSLSFGIADACMIACHSGALADAYATACCNAVRNIEMVHEVTEKALKSKELLSVVIIAGDRLGIGGRMEIKVL